MSAHRLAILLLHRPQQTTCLVQVSVVWPGGMRREAHVAGIAATATIEDAVGALISRPPILGCVQADAQVLLKSLEINFAELVVVVVIVQVGRLSEGPQTQLGLWL